MMKIIFATLISSFVLPSSLGLLGYLSKTVVALLQQKLPWPPDLDYAISVRVIIWRHLLLGGWSLFWNLTSNLR